MKFISVLYKKKKKSLGICLNFVFFFFLCVLFNAMVLMPSGGLDEISFGGKKKKKKYENSRKIISSPLFLSVPILKFIIIYFFLKIKIKQLLIEGSVGLTRTAAANLRTFFIFSFYFFVIFFLLFFFFFPFSPRKHFLTREGIQSTSK